MLSRRRCLQTIIDYEYPKLFTNIIDVFICNVGIIIWLCCCYNSSVVIISCGLLLTFPSYASSISNLNLNLFNHRKAKANEDFPEPFGTTRVLGLLGSMSRGIVLSWIPRTFFICILFIWIFIIISSPPQYCSALCRQSSGDNKLLF